MVASALLAPLSALAGAALGAVIPAHGPTAPDDSPRLAAIAAARSSGGSSQAAGCLLKRVVIRRGWPPAEAVAVRVGRFSGLIGWFSA